MQASLLALELVLADLLTPVGHDLGDQGAGARDDAERQRRDVEQGFGADALLGCQSLGTEQLPPDEEHRGGRDDGGGEGQHEEPTDRQCPTV
ncbi:hypothetical protein ABZ445_25485 [Streptomyces chartreusis]|uniref:hypothetical protein n=1 Tax=Streptomyces chartreusis TaxID=1969 RepID=UPI0033F0821C